MPTATPSTEADGRRARREQNREAVVLALVSLHGEGRYNPSAAEIAERAGLSLRSLFRYFDDTDDLVRAAVAHHLDTVRPLLPVDVHPGDPLDHRIAELVRRRLGLWVAIEPSARVARMRAPTVATLAVELRKNRGAQRAQVARIFSPELDALAPDRALRTLAAADVLCSFESFDMLRNDQELELPEVERTLVDALTALLT